jgi:hypothetical protein
LEEHRRVHARSARSRCERADIDSGSAGTAAATDDRPAAGSDAAGERRRRTKAPTAGVRKARQRVHVIIAGHQAPDTVLAAVVGLTRSGGRQSAIALHVLVAHHADGGARHRLAVLVHDPAGDHAAARQPEFDAFQLLAISELQRCPGLERPTLSVGQRHESRFRDSQRVASGRQLGQLKSAGVVGEDAAAAGDFGGGHEHTRPLHGPPAVGSDHTAADAPRGCRRLLGLRARVARGTLRTRLRRLQSGLPRLLSGEQRACGQNDQRENTHSSSHDTSIRPESVRSG